VESQPFSSREFRNALARFATGVAIVTAQENGKVHAMTANSFVPVSLDPPLVLVSVNNRSHMHRILPAAGRYGISVLAEHQRTLSDHFAGRPMGESEIRFVERAGATLLDGALAHFAVKMFCAYPAGDHTLYIGCVEHFEYREDQPLLFFAGSYQQLLNGDRTEGTEAADAGESGI
jgi:flavin reductase (DIM6/NTAB) family NADH-FMN oxidoreductase RutF